MAGSEDLLRQIQFIDQREREYFHQAKLGQDAIDFLRSDLGRYLHGCAKQEVEALRDKLEKVNPDSIWGRRKLRRLQKKAEAARFFMTWCAEAIQVGEVAYRELDEYRSEQ